MHDADMPDRMRRFLANPPQRLSPEGIAKRRKRATRRSCSHSGRVLDALCHQQKWKCAYCGGAMRKPSRKGDRRRATLDHVLPIARGGNNRKSNLVAACDACNGKKADMTLAEWKIAQAAIQEKARPKEGAWYE